MKKLAYIIPICIALSGCGITKTHLVPQAYMPEPPEILMREPKELATIKKPKTDCRTNGNMTVCDKTITVEGAKK